MFRNGQNSRQNFVKSEGLSRCRPKLCRWTEARRGPTLLRPSWPRSAEDGILWEGRDSSECLSRSCSSCRRCCRSGGRWRTFQFRLWRRKSSCPVVQFGNPAAAAAWESWCSADAEASASFSADESAKYRGNWLKKIFHKRKRFFYKYLHHVKDKVRIGLCVASLKYLEASLPVANLKSRLNERGFLHGLYAFIVG